MATLSSIPHYSQCRCFWTTNLAEKLLPAFHQWLEHRIKTVEDLPIDANHIYELILSGIANVAYMVGVWKNPSRRLRQVGAQHLLPPWFNQECIDQKHFDTRPS